MPHQKSENNCKCNVFWIMGFNMFINVGLYNYKTLFEIHII